MTGRVTVRPRPVRLSAASTPHAVCTGPDCKGHWCATSVSCNPSL